MSEGAAIEIPTWTALKSIIDSNNEFNYDYALQEDINELIVYVHQSHSVHYFTRILYSNTTDYNDFITFYAPHATRGYADGMAVMFDSTAGGDMAVREGDLGKLNVSTNNVDSLLTRILKELMKMNIHLNEITDLNLKNSDVDGEL